MDKEYHIAHKNRSTNLMIQMSQPKPLLVEPEDKQDRVEMDFPEVMAYLLGIVSIQSLVVLAGKNCNLVAQEVEEQKAGIAMTGTKIMEEVVAAVEDLARLVAEARVLMPLLMQVLRGEMVLPA